jgi:hypothetical protein
MSRIFKTSLIALFLTLILVIFTVPVAADTSQTKPPATTRAPVTWLKGVVSEKDASSFTVNNGETAVKLKVDNLTRFYRNVPVEKPAVTAVKPVETPRTVNPKTGDAGNTQLPREKQPSTTTVTARTKIPPTVTVTANRTKTPDPGPNLPVIPGTPVRFADLKVGDTVAVQSERSTDALLARTVTIYASKLSAPKAAPARLSISGTIVSVDEAKMNFTVKPVSGDAVTLNYNKSTAFTIIGSASLKARMQASVLYLSEAGVFTAVSIKASYISQGAPALTK